MRNMTEIVDPMRASRKSIYLPVAIAIETPILIAGWHQLRQNVRDHLNDSNALSVDFKPCAFKDLFESSFPLNRG